MINEDDVKGTCKLLRKIVKVKLLQATDCWHWRKQM